MCGPFTRDLRPVPTGYPDHIQALQSQHGLHSNGACAPFDYGFMMDQQQPAKNFGMEGVVPEVTTDPALFNWTFFDEACIPDLDATPIFTAANEQVPVTSQAPVFFSSPDDLIVNPIADSQCGWPDMGRSSAAPTFAPSISAGLPPKPPSDVAVKQECAGNSGASSPSIEMCGDSGHSTDGDNQAKGQQRKGKSKGKASVDQLPKELANHPCAATLLSAGIRIKGRSQDELLQVAERIKKRRRASAARCRARRASHIHVLEDENEELKEENAALKRRIAELTGGNTDLAKLLGTDMMTSLQSLPAMQHQHAC